MQGGYLLSSNSDILRHIDQVVASKTLASGLTIVHVPMNDADPRFYLGVTIAAGARYEPADKTGVAHFLEHMMFRGSKNYPSFKSLSRAFEWLGGEWNAATGYEHTEYWYNGNSRNWKASIELFSEFFCHPKLADIDIEREVIRRELQRETNEFGVNTDLDYQNFCQIWPDSNLAKPILGSLEQINSIRRKDVLFYKQQCYQPNQIVVCAVGMQNSNDVLAKMEACFKKYKAKSADVYTRQKDPKTSFRGPKITSLKHSDNEYHVLISFLACAAWDPKADEVNIITRILSDGYFSRLRERLREKLGLVYDIDASSNLLTDRGLLDISASVATEDLLTYLKEIYRTLKKLAHKGPSQLEIDLAKKRALLDLELVSTEPEALGFHWSWSLLCKQSPSLIKRKKAIEAVTKKSIHEHIKRIFRHTRSSLVILGPEDKILENKARSLFKSFRY